MKAGLGKSFAPAYVLDKLPPLYATDGDGDVLDKPLLAKWFSPYTGWTWYAAEHTDGTCFGYVDGLEAEWGYFDLNELESLRGMGGKLPLVERDHYFVPTTLRQLSGAEPLDEQRRRLPTTDPLRVPAEDVADAMIRRMQKDAAS